MRRKIRMGMIGGGQGSFIGAVHRMAAALDGQIELVCGAFSSDPERSRASGKELYLPAARCYDNYVDMIRKEAALPATERMDFVSIVTPNHLHFAPAMMSLEFGFHVVCDKPLCLHLQEAHQLKEKVSVTGLLFAVTYTYSGYPMVKQAKQMIQRGEFGEIRRVVVEYPQGWLSTAVENTNQKQASWRLDPDKGGSAGTMGDIGTHAAHLLEYVTGLQIESLCADLHSHISSRKLDDDGSVLLRMNNGARGVLYASQVSAGEENNLRIKVYGELGGLEWAQLEPNSLIVRWLDKPVQVLRAGTSFLHEETQKYTRLPAGHPEGYIEAFANIYKNVAYCIDARLAGEKPDPAYLDFPGIEDGVRGMQFIEAVVKSGKEGNSKWLNFSDLEFLK